MAGYKETPRQKMIAMMYLVLTALLALNVSKEMLDAFLVVNESVESTIENFSSKIDAVYSKFEQQYLISPEKNKIFWKDAQKADSLTKDIETFIEDVKYELIMQSEKSIETIEQAKNTPLHLIKSKDKYTEPTRYFFGNSEDGSGGAAGELKTRINSYRQQMLELMNQPLDSKRLGLYTDGAYQNATGQPQNWEQHNFYYTILAADVTILNKLISEVHNAEFDVINYLYSSVNEDDFKFDEIKAKVISQNSYILKGQQYEAEVLVAAYDTKQNPEVFVLQGVDEINEANINRASTIEGNDGVVKLNLPGNTEGPHKFAGLIRVLGPNGEKIDHPFKSDYLVAPPSLTVAATRMNVFYIGVDNPVSISVPGMALENITPRISNGTLRRDPNNNANWIVKVEMGTTKTVISANANSNGTIINMGSREFRVKRLPTPTAEIAMMTSGSIEKNLLLAAAGIIPSMGDFDFDAKFDIQSFTMGTIRNGGDWFRWRTNGNRFSGEMSEAIKNASKGQKLFFENIQAKGPDGSIRTLNSIILTIN